MPTQTSTFRTALAGEIRAEIARQGVTLGTLSVQTGLSIRTLSRYLNGHQDFRVEHIGLLCDALGVPFSILAGRAEARAA